MSTQPANPDIKFEGWTIEPAHYLPEDMNGGGQMVPGHYRCWAARDADGACACGVGDSPEEAMETTKVNIRQRNARERGILTLHGNLYGLYGANSEAFAAPHAIVELAQTEIDRVAELMNGQRVVIILADEYEKLKRHEP